MSLSHTLLLHWATVLSFSRCNIVASRWFKLVRKQYSTIHIDLQHKKNVQVAFVGRDGTREGLDGSFDQQFQIRHYRICTIFSVYRQLNYDTPLT